MPECQSYHSKKWGNQQKISLNQQKMSLLSLTKIEQSTENVAPIAYKNRTYHRKCRPIALKNRKVNEKCRLYV